MNKKIISLLMVVCMFMTLLTGCGSKAVSNTEANTEKITVTDMLGREVTINGTPKRVVATKCAIRFYCYVGKVDKLVGAERIEKKGSTGRTYAMANPSLAELPVIGECFSNDYEKILAVKPDVIFTTGDDKATIDKLQEKTGIPVVTVTYGDSTIFDSEIYNSLKLIGKVMNEEKRAKEVVDYMENCKKDLNDRTKDITDDKKESVYVGGLAHSGSHGIESTWEHYPLFKVINAKNVVKGTGKKSYAMIDKEKILQWNPDKMFIDLNSLAMIQQDYKKNPNFYKTLDAFKNGQVYSQLPYIWYWTNVETAIADAYYIGKVLYPEQFKDVEPEKKADEIYKFFVGKELYKEMAKDFRGGFRKITIEDLEK